jgi:hypothetical protein
MRFINGMKMRDETAIIDLNQNLLGSSLLLCPVYGNIDHGELIPLDLNWYAAVACAMSHLYKDFAACVYKL